MICTLKFSIQEHPNGTKAPLQIARMISGSGTMSGMTDARNPRIFPLQPKTWCFGEKKAEQADGENNVSITNTNLNAHITLSHHVHPLLQT